MSSEHTIEIPSRERILSTISGDPGITKTGIFTKLFSTNAQLQPLSHRLSAMIRDGQIYIKDRGYFIEDRHKVGRVSKVSKHKAFVNFLDSSESWFLPDQQAKYCLHSEIVEVVPDYEENEAVTARMTKIINPTESLMGRLEKQSDGHYRFFSVNNQDSIEILNDEPISYEGWLFANLCPTKDRRIRKLTFFTPIEPPSIIQKIRMASLQKNGFTTYHSPELEKEALLTAAEIERSEHDFTSLPLITIDGASTRDRDDGFYVRQIKSGDWHVFVAIADVSRYVAEGSGIDAFAKANGTSVYTHGHVLKMLPALLSNEICSLNPHVKRSALVLQLVLDSTGEVKSSFFFEATVQSHAAYTYGRAQALIDNAAPSGEEESTVPILKSAHNLWKLLRDKRNPNGAISFERKEQTVDIVNDEVNGFQFTHHFETHDVVAELMILANVAAAKFIEENQGYGVYRHHPGIPNENIHLLNDILFTFDIETDLSSRSSMQDIAQARSRLPEEVKRHFDLTLRRAMTYASYSSNNPSHFGLSEKSYTHFTSPIRRYPDLVVHRIIKNILSYQGYKTLGGHLYTLEELEHISVHCSERSHSASIAERDVFDALSAMWWEKHIGVLVEGNVIGFNENYAFMTLGNTPSQGSCALSALHENVERGEKLLVRVVKSDVETGRISVELASSNDESRLPF